MHRYGSSVRCALRFLRKEKNLFFDVFLYFQTEPLQPLKAQHLRFPSSAERFHDPAKIFLKYRYKTKIRFEYYVEKVFRDDYPFHRAPSR